MAATKASRNAPPKPANAKARPHGRAATPSQSRGSAVTLDPDEDESGDEFNDEDDDLDSDDGDEDEDSDEDLDDDSDNDSDEDDDSDDDDWEDDDPGDDLGATPRPTPNPGTPVPSRDSKGRWSGEKPGGGPAAATPPSRVDSDPAPLVVNSKDLLPPLPKPKARSRGRWNMDFNKGMDYWESIPVLERRGRVYATVYRTWPIIDRERNGKKKQIGQRDEPWRDIGQLQEEYGSGDYKIWLNDSGKGETLCVIVAHTDRDMRQWPPAVELEDIVLDDPSNKSYVESLKIQGVLRQEGEMADGVKELTGTVERLANKLVERKPDDTVGAAGMKGVVEMMTAAGVASTKLLQEAIGRKEQAQDPMAVHRSIMESAKQLSELGGRGQGGGGGNEIGAAITCVMPMFQMAIDSMKAQVATLTEIAREGMRARENPAPVSVEGGGSSFLKSLREIREAKEVLAELGGGGGDEGEKTPWWAQYLPAGLALADRLAVVAQGVMGKAGQAPAPGTHPGQLPNPQAAPPGGMTAPQSAPQAGQPGQPGAIPPGGQNVETRQIMQFLESIRLTLIGYLRNPEKDGVDFAQYLIDVFGREVYEQARGQGKDRLLMALRMDGPIWEALSTTPDAPEFIDHFLRYEELVAQEDDGETGVEEEAEPEPPAPRRTAAPKVNGSPVEETPKASRSRTRKGTGESPVKESVAS